MASKPSASSLANLISKFTGEENELQDINFYLNQIRDIAELEKWADNKKLIVTRLNLEGRARQFFLQSTDAKKASTFEDLAKILTAKFSKNQSFQDKLKQFSKIKQVQGQKVQDLAEKITQITANYIDMENNDSEAFKKLQENLAYTKFLEALRPDLKVEVQKMGPKSFKEAVAIAKNVERALEENVNLIEVVNNVEVNHLMQTQLQNNLEIVKLKEEINKLKQEKANAQREQENRITCHICGKGHLTTKCWNYPTNSQRRIDGGSRHQFHGYRSARTQNRGARRGFRPYERNRFGRNNLN